MGHRIHINYDEVRAVAGEFEQQSEVTGQIIKDLNTRAEQLMTGWEGRAQQTFIQQLESCHRRMSRVPGMLTKIASALRTAADRIEQAEREAQLEMDNLITSNDY
jgi:WXG100 family type VII secretion target